MSATVTGSQLIERLLAHQRLASAGSEVEDEEQLIGFLSDMRDDLDDLRGLLADVPDAEEIVDRFEYLVNAAGREARRDQRVVEAYLFVRGAPEPERSRVEGLLADRYAAMASLLREAGEDDLAGIAAVPFDIRWLGGPPRSDARLEYWEGSDEIGDFLASQVDPRHPARVLREAAYGMAASYPLAHYVLWPIYRERVDTHDPFRSDAELWAIGVEWVRPQRDLVWAWRAGSQ